MERIWLKRLLWGVLIVGGAMVLFQFASVWLEYRLLYPSEQQLVRVNSPDGEQVAYFSVKYEGSTPMIIFRQDWCYDGGGDDYRLGYVDREHWSDPNLLGHGYSTTDEDASELSPICEEEIIALQARDPQYYGLRNE